MGIELRIGQSLHLKVYHLVPIKKSRPEEELYVWLTTSQEGDTKITSDKDYIIIQGDLNFVHQDAFQIKMFSP